MSTVTLEPVIMIAKSCLHVIIGSFIFLHYYSDLLLLRSRNTSEYLIYCYEVTDLSFVCFKGFGTAISSSAPLLGGTLTTGFGAPQGLGSSTFGQQPTTGTSFTKIKGVYYQPLTASVFWLIPVLALMRL